MSKASRKMARAKKLSARKAAQKHYRENRNLGPCYVKGCQNNGDFKEECRFCKFEVQSCTLHNPMARQKAIQHVFIKHPVKAVPTAVLGLVRGKGKNK